ncbi:hypothetical protein [Burkholderia gladioli]|uniref:hypothetical protein n=1 Tax=Burkholderia gladioli TaxID=28095 RepID=UPI0010FDA17C|nr:hypothetical protein [Burkholderia gladioli]MBJ9711213.1 hypothetical protein [Burkholderia gladioli]MCH7275171.1 hypothetical protein [Burkholderia gladioli]MDN7500919.1 hypothetical protein [Burkholderia gladioli]MDR8086251.1 hypothetical protein [Burkholderia gladioli]MDZ4041811.1 hypothetical protein [Burkholderia gladioli pv. alliicola]
MKLSSMFKWAKDLGGKPEPSGVFKLGHGVATPTTGMGKSPFSDAIVKTLASIGACPGDIVEVNDFGAARVVGRSPHLASERPDASEQAIREALTRIYGDDAAGLDNVTAGANVVVFRRTQNACSKLTQFA